MKVIHKLPFDLLFLVSILESKPVIRSFKILDADFQLLVDFQPWIVYFPQSGGLFFHVLMVRMKNILSSLLET